MAHVRLGEHMQSVQLKETSPGTLQMSQEKASLGTLWRVCPRKAKRLSMIFSSEPPISFFVSWEFSLRSYLH